MALEIQKINTNDDRCRVCLKTDEAAIFLNTFFENQGEKLTFLDIILECSNIKFENQGEKPNKICLECSEEAKISYQFKTRCENSELLLQKEKLNAVIEEDYKPFVHYIKDEENSEVLENTTSEEEISESQQELDLKTQSDVKPYKCLDCGKQYRYKQGLRRHRKQHTDSNTSNCPYCEYIPETPIALGKHMEITHEDKKNISCTLCDKKFFRKSNLKAHMVIHSGVKQYTCEMCGLSFALSGNLVAHRRLHTGEKPYKCTYCGKSFAQNGSLRSHLVIHSSDKSFICGTCGAAFSRSIALKNHQVRHSNERPFKCTMCDKGFAFSSDMKRHMTIHSGVKKYKCDMCEKRFNRNSNLRVHLKIHTGETPHVCHVCGKGFIQAHCLRTHLNTHNEKTV